MNNFYLLDVKLTQNTMTYFHVIAVGSEYEGGKKVFVLRLVKSDSSDVFDLSFYECLQAPPVEDTSPLDKNGYREIVDDFCRRHSKETPDRFVYCRITGDKGVKSMEVIHEKCKPF